MLKRIVIRNYALIKHLDITFADGLSTITGETGAGKSIMLGALGLVLGNRADTQVLLDKEQKCTVEAAFGIKGYGLEPLFQANNLDFEEETLFRREINPAGKSRAFINDTPVTLPVLKEIGAKLINIHSQHEILVLNDRDFQLALIDSFAGHEAAVVHYQQHYREYKQKMALLDVLKERYAAQLAQHDYDLFLFEELSVANLDQVDLPFLESELKILENAAEIRSLLHQLDKMFYGEPQEFISSLRNTIQQLEKLGNGGSLASFTGRLQSMWLEADDLGREISSLQEQVRDDPEQVALLQDRISHLYHLLQKHRATSVEELITLRSQLDEKLQQQFSTGDAIQKTGKEVEVLLETLRLEAYGISDTRMHHIKPLTEHLMVLLHKLGMPDATLDFRFTHPEMPGMDGIDQVSMLFSANLGSPPDLISRVASGGELSRLMLAVKSVLSSRKLIPTIIFDEIDTGVSGEIAGKTGSILLEMGKNMQVIAITHLPQIAAKGTAHYLAVKGSDNGKAISTVIRLSDDERLEAIARMLSDGEPTTESLANARRLLRTTAP